MPNIASAKKRMRQNRSRREAGRARRAKLRTSLRRLDAAIASGDIDAVRERWTEAQSLLDSSARRGIIHPNRAARRKSRLRRRIQSL